MVCSGIKTTLEIPDALFRQAKATAANEGRSMKDYVTEAIAEKLSGQGQGWRAVLGKLTRERKSAFREIDERIAKADFNKVDPDF